MVKKLSVEFAQQFCSRAIVIKIKIVTPTCLLFIALFFSPEKK